jgi:lipoprotein-anchoring transpeptidase ErfK/SrfK
MLQHFATAKPLGVAAMILSLAGCANIAQKNTETIPPIAPLQPFATDVATRRAHAVQLQIFLDEHDFRPGAVDGRTGEFFTKALRQYNAANGIPGSIPPDVSDVTPYTEYTISADDLSRVGTMATDNAEIAKQKSCPYTSVSSFVAERFHTTRAFLSALNPGRNVDELQAGDTVQVPNVAHPFRIDALPSIRKASRNPSLASRKISIDVSTRILEVRNKDKVVASFPITPGSSDHPAPIGDWEITGIATFPWFRYDEGVLERGERTEEFFNIPPGPRNPVGILWMQLNRPGDGIHGSPNAETIGRAGSHGCIRLANWDAALIRTLVTTGTPVSIH